METPKGHWEKVYQAKQADAVSWFQEPATRSLEIIRSAGATSDASEEHKTPWGSVQHFVYCQCLKPH
jgi:hypothetical protein